jgi:hypothetical protein
VAYINLSTLGPADVANTTSEVLITNNDITNVPSFIPVCAINPYDIMMNQVTCPIAFGLTNVSSQHHNISKLYLIWGPINSEIGIRMLAAILKDNGIRF